ncbi:hypothetical protein [uncultured Mucilaginibacter sp.]|uniref:hypothetical protein n=1 Tax=uncultured Mucilaginibacter sp. TaxID=797541 RepID=UPI002633A32D|nr:hypothetical protein [uncultured Mucilaginibacter sp.]
MRTTLAIARKLKSTAKRSSFYNLFVGIGSLINVIPAHFDTYSNIPSDDYSIKSHWQNVGNYLNSAMKETKVK